MFINLFLKGLLTGFLVSVPVGPIAVMVIQRTASRNLKSGLYSGLGVAIIDSVWAIVAGFSVSFIITFLQTYKLYIQIIGAILLFLLGLNIFLSHPVNDWKKMRRKGSNLLQMFFSSVGIALSNPMPVLSYIAIFASFRIIFNVNEMIEPVSFISGFFIGAFIWWTILTSSINLFRHRFNLRILWWFNKISGSLIMAFVMALTIYVLVKGNPVL
jgi:threonine/homoserine/homoserine lactone efflux protein